MFFTSRFGAVERKRCCSVGTVCWTRSKIVCHSQCQEPEEVSIHQQRLTIPSLVIITIPWKSVTSHVDFRPFLSFKKTYMELMSKCDCCHWRVDTDGPKQTYGWLKTQVRSRQNPLESSWLPPLKNLRCFILEGTQKYATNFTMTFLGQQLCRTLLRTSIWLRRETCLATLDYSQMFLIGIDPEIHIPFMYSTVQCQLHVRTNADVRIRLQSYTPIVPKLLQGSWEPY